MISNKKIHETIQLNKQFYKNHQEEFSKTRQNVMSGWKDLIPIIVDNVDGHEISVLDLACGNGRLFQYLRENLLKPVKYLGLDNNDYLLIEAVLKNEDATFRSHDVLLDVAGIENTYDLVFAFGLTHHIPGSAFRLEWFEKVSKLVNTNGLFIFTNWQLDDDKRFQKAIPAEDLEENDYYYGWDDSQDKRYIHIYSETEIEKITKTLNENNLQLLKTYYNDGKTQKLNKYFIFKRIS